MGPYSAQSKPCGAYENMGMAMGDQVGNEEGKELRLDPLEHSQLISAMLHRRTELSKASTLK